jgi:two-component system sensor histidine kinase KdpD
VAVASVTAITGLVYGLREIMPVVSTGVAYLLAVLLVSSYWGFWLGALTSALSALFFNFFHIPPTDGFTIAEAENWVAVGVFLVAALVTSTLADAARARAAEAEQRRREADLAADMARVLLGSASAGGSLAAVGKMIAGAYGVSFVRVVPEWCSAGPGERAIALVVDGDRAGTVLVPRDTTEETLESLRSRVIPALEALVGAAARRDALEAQLIETKALRRSDVVKTTLLRAVSHDLRSPITAIKAAAEALAAAGLSREAQRELISVVGDESARLERLVANLLDLSRLESGAAEPRSDWVSLEEIVRAAVGAVPSPAGGFEISIDPEVPLIRADAAQLERAIANIADNAVRHAGDGSVGVRVRSTGPRVLIGVRDAGPGIRREELRRVFEPFYRASDHAGSGSGLGLAIARGFVEANGGRVRAQSEPGEGSTFTIDLPVPATSRRAKPLDARERPLV